MARSSASAVSLAGLPRPRGAGARARRLRLASESDEELGARLFRMLRPLRALDEGALASLAQAIDLPLGELVASPFGLRMIALGARLGVRTVRHEARAMQTRGVWEHGVLLTGKYDTFQQDDPLVAYHPEHVAKWAPHEHLHRAVGFFDRPSATRFERYVGARLNEILPVSTWYGLEHALRLENDGARFDAAAEGLQPSASVERATWRTDSPERLQERCVRAAPRVRWTIEHTERELDAVDQELLGGRVIRVVHADEPHLDASGDAMAYALAHDARLTSEPVAVALAAYAAEARFTRLDALRRSVDDTLDALLFEPITLDLPAMLRAQDSRRAWDLASRLAHASPAQRARVFATGDVGPPHAPGARLDAMDVAQLDRGLRGAAPRTRAHVRRALVARFATSAELLDRAPLPERFARLLEHDGAPTWLVELARLEGLILGARRSDPRVESLLSRGPLPQKGDAFVTASAAFRLGRFETDVLALHAGGEPLDRPTHVLVGRVDGAVSLVAVDAATAHAWEALSPQTARVSAWATLIKRECSRSGPRSGVPVEGTDGSAPRSEPLIPGARAILTALAAHGAIGWARP